MLSVSGYTENKQGEKHKVPGGPYLDSEKRGEGARHMAFKGKSIPGTRNSMQKDQR